MDALLHRPFPCLGLKDGRFGDCLRGVFLRPPRRGHPNPEPRTLPTFTNPHAHFGFVPLKDGKLSWKGFFPDKAALGAMQDRFHGRVGALYGLSRGEKRSVRCRTGSTGA